MLNPQKDDIEPQDSVWETKQKQILSVIKVRHRPIKIQTKGFYEGIMRIGLKDLQEATMNGELVIDKVANFAPERASQFNSAVLHHFNFSCF